MAEPLTKASIAELKKASALAADAALKCRKAAAAGVDMGELEVRCDSLQKSLQQLLDIYDGGKNWNVPKNGDE